MGTTTKGPLDDADWTDEGLASVDRGVVGAGVNAGCVLGSVGAAEGSTASDVVEGASELAAGWWVGLGKSPSRLDCPAVGELEGSGLDCSGTSVVLEVTSSEEPVGEGVITIIGGGESELVGSPAGIEELVMAVITDDAENGRVRLEIGSSEGAADDGEGDGEDDRRVSCVETRDEAYRVV